MRTTRSIDITGSIEDVFRLTLDDVTAWSNVVTEDVVVEDVNNGDVGTKFRSVTEDRGQRMEFEGTVTQYDAPNLCAVKLVGQQFDIFAEYTFEDIGNDQTRVTQDSVVKGKGLLAVLFMCCGWLMKKGACDALNKELQSLKQFCESQTAVAS